MPISGVSKSIEASDPVHSDKSAVGLHSDEFSRSGLVFTELATPKTADGLKLADQILLRKFRTSSEVVEVGNTTGFAPILQISKKPEVPGQVDAELPDESRTSELSAHQTPSSMIDELPDGSMRVDGHPTGNNLTLADRVLLRRFASPVRADGSKRNRRDVMVQSNSDECSAGEERADGSEECVNVGHVPATTSTATALLDSEPVFPTCIPLSITEAYDSTLQLQSTGGAARSKDAFHETPLLLSTSGTMGQEHRDESSQTEHCATREKDRKRRRFVGKVSRASRWIGPRRNHNVRDLRKFQKRVPRLPCFDSRKLLLLQVQSSFRPMCSGIETQILY